MIINKNDSSQTHSRKGDPWDSDEGTTCCDLNMEAIGRIMPAVGQFTAYVTFRSFCTKEVQSSPLSTGLLVKCLEDLQRTADQAIELLKD